MTDREEQVVIHASNRKLPCHSPDACAFQKNNTIPAFQISCCTSQRESNEFENLNPKYIFKKDWHENVKGI